MTRAVAIWLRVSSEDQKLDSQRDAVERYVEARGWDVTARFIEQGSAGPPSTGRSWTRSSIAPAESGFDAVIIFRGDCSFRTAGKGCLFIDELISIGT